MDSHATLRSVSGQTPLLRATLVVVSDEKKHTGFIAGGPRRVRGEGEGFWSFLRGWIVSLFRVDRRL